MVQFIGTYKLESQENYKEYLMSLGLDDAKATKEAELREDAIISALDGESVTALYGGKTLKYPFNKEIDHVLGEGHHVKTTTTIANDVITLKTKLNEEGTLMDENVLNFTDTGLTVTSTNTKGVKAVRKYKRS